MELVTEDIREQLMENGRAQQPVKGTEDERDYYPVVKLFNPAGAATWLITEMDPDEPDILFGLCDLGMGFPELGSVRLSELQSVRGPLGLGVERDVMFTATHPLSAYARAAREAGHIVSDLPRD
jgi:hypothetical protein